MHFLVSQKPLWLTFILAVGLDEQQEGATPKGKGHIFHPEAFSAALCPSVVKDFADANSSYANRSGTPLLF